MSERSIGFKPSWVLGGLLASAVIVTPDPAQAAEEEEALLEFHYNPVANAQVAIWLETEDGTFLADVFLTQSVGKLGIGNRPGLWDFLSSWRAPYGPRLSVLPVWAHRRGKTYPRIVFHDPNASNQTSLGFHEGTSSAEPYHCRPLNPEENEAIMDTLTCPSPATFQSDKGRFADGGDTTVYPPRNDIVGFEEADDHEDILEYADLNELDTVTGATPAAGSALATFKLDREAIGEGEKVVAWIEVSLEGDQNENYAYDREDDHFVDPKLAAYGVAYLGQPAVVYRVELDPAEEAAVLTDAYAGYADWDGATGTLHPPDSTISSGPNTGSDRLRLVEGFDGQYRFAVYSHGWGEAGTGGTCEDLQLAPVGDLTVRAGEFDRVNVSFTMPAVPEDTDLKQLRIFYQTPETDDFDLDMAHEAPSRTFCRDEMQTDCIDGSAGSEIELQVDQLFGNYTYTVAVVFDDVCGNQSALATQDVTTPIQEFQTIEGFCFIATAAYGGQWVEEVASLRWFRDFVLRKAPLGEDVIRFYYAYGPAMAKVIAPRPWLRSATRTVLQPVVEGAKMGRAKHRLLTGLAP